MTNSGYLHQLKSLLLAVADLPPDQRSTKLDQLCAGDDRLRADIESLLQHDDNSGELLQATEVLPYNLPEHSSTLSFDVSQAAAPPTREPGQIISHYRIEKLLGRGGMGDVFLATDRNLDRKVAIKFLTISNQTDEVARQRFLIEAQAASSLDHPHIGVVHEFGHDGDQRLFTVMGYHEGGSIKELLADGPLKATHAVSLMRQVLSGLSVAHTAGIIHRDLKPGNVMLGSHGDARIIDFGLAKLTEQAAITRTGVSLGTVAYMSPQQVQGQPIDGRSDLFAAGVMLHELLTGKLPFDRETPAAVILAILQDDPDPLPAEIKLILPGIEAVIGRALTKSPDERYRSAAEMLADLQQINERPPTDDDSPDETQMSWIDSLRRKRRLFFPLTLIMIYLTLATLAVTGHIGPGLLRRDSSRSFSAHQAIAPFLNLYGTGGRMFGSMVTGAGDVNGDGFADWLIGDAPRNALSSGTAYLYLGGDPADTDPDIIFQGETFEDNFGRQARSVGDVNNDGYDDILISAPLHDTKTGQVYLFFGGADMDNIPDVVFTGHLQLGQFGSGLGQACDLNGDGIGDMVITAYANSELFRRGGSVYIYFGRPTSLWPATLSATDADLQFVGDKVNLNLGIGIACPGDLNRDGIDDLVVGTSRPNDTRVYFGGDSSCPMDDRVDLILQADQHQRFGRRIAPAHDLNGDGGDDLVFMARNGALIYLGSSKESPLDGTADLVLQEQDEFAVSFGSSFAGAGDLNGDGFADLIFGDTNHTQVAQGAGAVLVFLGGNRMDTTADAIMLGESQGDRFGFTVAGVGDINGNGRVDILVGAPGHDIDGVEFGAGNGAAYLFELPGGELP